jgi:hypothetical protein
MADEISYHSFQHFNGGKAELYGQELRGISTKLSAEERAAIFKKVLFKLNCHQTVF